MKMLGCISVEVWHNHCYRLVLVTLSWPIKLDVGFDVIDNRISNDLI